MDLLNELDKLISRDNESSAGNGVIPLDVLLRKPDGNNVTSIEVGGQFVRSIPEVVAILVAYSIVIILSLFGNSLVCHVIYKNKRLHTVTNIFIANLSISDMVITILNIPFNIVRNIMEHWPFGKVMCILVNFTLMASVYASTFTMAAIAMDRYIVIMYPLKPRITTNIGLVMAIVTWVLATVISLPFAIYAKVERVELFLKSVDRCRICYPEPDYVYERSITLFTFISQYVVPMVIIGIAYGQIVRKLWIRPMVGQATTNQQNTQYKIKRKTIRMLIVVVVIFCICWMPLNLYHLLTDFHPNTAIFSYNSSVYLACHWFAMSSVCYNPFVYCWLNQHFREKIRNKFTWIQRRCSRIHPGEEVEGTLIRCDKLIKRKLLTNTRSQSSSGSSGMKTGTGCPCPSRPKKLRTISDNNTSRNASEENGSCNRLACLGGWNKCRHPKRVLFKEGTNNLELCHVVCATSARTNYHLQRNNFGDYELVPSDSSNSKHDKDALRI